MADRQPQRPPAPLVAFARGVIARLAVWPTLRVAVQEKWGGPNSDDKRTWLASEIVDAFERENPSPDDQYVEEMLLQVMADEYDCFVEDGSGEEVGQDIVKMWMESRMGKHDTILKFQDLAEKMKGKKVAAQITVEENDVDGEGNDDDDDDDDEWEDGSNEGTMEVDEAPTLLGHGHKNEPEVDEDGFSLVKRKKVARR